MGRNEHTVAWSDGPVHFLSESSLQYGSGILKAKSFLLNADYHYMEVLQHYM